MSIFEPKLTEMERLWLWVVYEGPFLRIANRLWKVSNIAHNMTDEELDALPVVKDGGIRDRLACAFDWLDHRWMVWYVKHDRRPNKRWTR